MEFVPPEKWSHVSGHDNPADCASRGLFPSELVHHSLWWDGLLWLKQSSADWPKQDNMPHNNLHDKERDVSLLTTITNNPPVIPLDRYSSFHRLKHVTAWMFRFISNCRRYTNKCTSPLSTRELVGRVLLDQDYPTRTFSKGARISQATMAVAPFKFSALTSSLCGWGMQQYIMHVSIVACPHPLSCCIYTALISCLAAYILPSSPVLLHIYCTCFSTFLHYHPYIFQHFNGKVFSPLCI